MHPNRRKGSQPTKPRNKTTPHKQQKRHLITTTQPNTPKTTPSLSPTTPIYQPNAQFHTNINHSTIITNHNHSHTRSTFGLSTLVDFDSPSLSRRYGPPVRNQLRYMGTPAGDYHPDFHKKRHPSINPIYYENPNNNNSLLGNDGSLNPLLLGQDSNHDPNYTSLSSTTPNTISSAAFASTIISDSSITVGGQKTTKIPSATMMNIDPDLIQFIDNKSWLTARKIDDTLPPGLPEAMQRKIREFQQKLPAPVNIDTASILALPKHMGGFGFEHLTFIQGRLLPMIASGLDVLLRAPTSSGKTLAYVIPLLERLLYSRHAPNHRDIPILILVPSRELALQTTATIQHLLSLHRRKVDKQYGVFSLIGGSSVMRVEQEPLQRTDIAFLVATTSRLLDHIDHTPGFKERLKECKMVVFDEVDYLLAQTGGKDIGRVLESVHEQRQTIMLSATLTPAVRKVASFALRKGACLVDVVKDSIVSLGTGLSSAFSGTKNNNNNNDGIDNEQEQDENNMNEKRIMEFNQDDNDLLLKRQQELVGHFINQDGEKVYLDHSELIDKLGTNELVYEKQSFKHIDDIANKKALDLKMKKMKQQGLHDDNHDNNEQNDTNDSITNNSHPITQTTISNQSTQINGTKPTRQLHGETDITSIDDNIDQVQTNFNTITPQSTLQSQQQSQSQSIASNLKQKLNQHDITQREHDHSMNQHDMNNIVKNARQAMNSVDVGSISSLIKQNESIVDELALYSDDEDELDPNLVVFDEINKNVQHYVQAATTRESLDIMARLFDDIGGRYMYAKQQVQIHNIRIKNDPSYEQFEGQELEPPKPPKIMVFCETARYTQYLTSLFCNVIDLDQHNAYESILEIHSKKGQNYRTRVSQQFSNSNWNAGCILFSSDVAARGLDTNDVDCVIQLGLPPSRQQWIHRVGRVARDGDQLGLSLTIVTPQHAASFARMTSGLSIHVPKVGSLGLGIKQDTFNNTTVDPLQNLKLTYGPTTAAKYGQLGEYIDLDAPGLISGQLRLTHKEKQQQLNDEQQLLLDNNDINNDNTNHKKGKKQEPLLLDSNNSRRRNKNSIPRQRRDKNIESYEDYDPRNDIEPRQGAMSLFDELRQGDDGELGPGPSDEFYLNRTITNRDENDDNNDNNEYDENNEFDDDYDQYDDDNNDEFNDEQDDNNNNEQEESEEQTLWHGTIERAVSTTYINRIKDDQDKKLRFDQLNTLTMSANTGEISTNVYARYDYILSQVLATKVLQIEDLRLNAERAYVSYLGHHIALFNRSNGIEEKLKMVKLSKTPFKNRHQVAKLAYDFAKGIGLCGPNGDLPPPTISSSNAQRLGFKESNEFITIGAPTLFSHIVEIERQTNEKQQIEQQREDHRVRRKYWEATKLAESYGQPKPAPPPELIEQRQRIALQKQNTAIERQKRAMEKHEQIMKQRIDEQYNNIQLLRDAAKLQSIETTTTSLPPSQSNYKKRHNNNNQHDIDDWNNNNDNMNNDINNDIQFKPQLFQGTLRTATPNTRKKVVIEFSDDENVSQMVQVKKIQRNVKQQVKSLQQQAQQQNNNMNFDMDHNVGINGQQLTEKMTQYFPNYQKPQNQPRGYGKESYDQQQQRQNTKHDPSSKFFEEHQKWLKHQEHQKAHRDKMTYEQLKRDEEAQQKYDKSFKRHKERSKREPAPGRELLQKSSLYAKEPRRIRTGELDHKVHLDIVL